MNKKNMNRTNPDPESLSKAVQEWTMLATVFQSMMATSTAEPKTVDEQKLVPVTSDRQRFRGDQPGCGGYRKSA
jgi:hypothetical protein